MQTGASALRDIVAGSVGAGILLWAGVAIGAAGIAEGISSRSVSTFVMGPWLGLLLMGAGLARLGGGLSSAHNHRASDLEIDELGFTIRAGRKDGLGARWSDLKPEHCSIEDGAMGALGRSFGGSNYTRAFFVHVDGLPNLVAETSEAAEEASASALVEAIAARAGASSAPTAVAGADIVTTCAACGAPATPADADTVACVHCGARVAIPPVVRERVRDAAREIQSQAALERAVEKILDQPGARRINLSLVVAAFALSAATAAGPLVIWLTARHGIAVVALAIAAYAGARAVIERRHALREIVLGFAARVDDRGVSRCRRCLGPLANDEHVIARCPWCGASNVRGVAFGRRAAEADATERRLDAELARRRMRGVAMTIVSIAAFGAALVVLFVR